MPHLFVVIKELDSAFASTAELDVRTALESAIMSSNLVTITGSGSGFGEMDVSVCVSDAKAGIAEMEKIADQLGIRSRVTIEELEESSQKDEDLMFLSRLGSEVGPEQCRDDACQRFRIAGSVFCKVHHFRQVFSRLPAIDSAD